MTRTSAATWMTTSTPCVGTPSSPSPIATLNTKPAAPLALRAPDPGWRRDLRAHQRQKTYGLDRFWNGWASRVERGLEVSVLALVDEQRQAMALTAGQTPVPPNDESRMAFYLRHVKDSRPFWPEGLRYGGFDGFDAKRPFVDGLCQTG